MIRQAVVGLIAISPIFFASSQNSANSADVPVKQFCQNPIGRITHGSSENFRRGETVCEGDVVLEPREVQFLCFSSSSLVSLSGEAVTVTQDTCESATASNPRVRPCSRLRIGRFCLIPKGPEEQFQLIQPDAVSENPRPAISWLAVAEAETYTVRVLGPDISWERTVDAEATELSYPEEEVSMTTGNAYEVFVIAEMPQNSITASKVVNIQLNDELISLVSVKRRKED